MQSSTCRAIFTGLALAVLAAGPAFGSRAFVYLGEEVFIDGIGELDTEKTHFYRFANAAGESITVLIDVSARDSDKRQLSRIWLKTGNRLSVRRRLEAGGAEETAVIGYLRSALRNFDDERSATNLEDDRKFMLRCLQLLEADLAARAPQEGSTS